MKISVAVCTWNRAELLAQTLEEMTLLRDPGCDWEVVVVDNGSTDGTPDVLSRFRDRLPLRVVHEPKLGHSNARNAAVDAVTGDYIVWTDDDVLVPEDWLVAYRGGFERHSEASFFGGPIDPWLEGPAPPWFDLLVHELGAGYLFALLDWNGGEVPIREDRIPFGANMAFRVDVQRATRFDPRLGLKGTQTTRGEERAVLQELIAQGHRGWWLPETRVRHWVPRQRLTLKYVRDWWVGAGRALTIRKPRSGQYLLFGVPVSLIRRRVRLEFPYRMARLRGDWSSSFEHLRELAYAHGAILEIRSSRAAPD
jgi:glycosyltransferase involved in cell wall biosynthesis